MLASNFFGNFLELFRKIFENFLLLGAKNRESAKNASFQAWRRRPNIRSSSVVSSLTIRFKSFFFWRFFRFLLWNTWFCQRRWVVFREQVGIVANESPARKNDRLVGAFVAAGVPAKDKALARISVTRAIRRRRTRDRDKRGLLWRTFENFASLFF